MRIGHFISLVSRPAGHERNVPAHIQLPMRSMEELARRGHQVHLISNACSAGRVFPVCMPATAQVHTVVDSRRRTESGLPHARWSVKPVALCKQLLQIRQLARTLGLDVLHVHGYDSTIALGGLLRWLRLTCPVAATLYKPPHGGGWAKRKLWQKVSAFSTATDFVARRGREQGWAIQTIRHGLVRHLPDEVEGYESHRRHRVLFWRTGDRANGADLAAQAFDELAAVHREVTFTMALRGEERVPGIKELERRHANVQVYRLPYPQGISLARLMAEAMIVVLPFREHSVHPQLAIAETLAAGVPVITSDIGSASELMQHGRGGLLVPVDDAQAVGDSIGALLAKPDRVEAMRRLAAEDFAAKWNWTGHSEQLERFYERILNDRA